jgi:hypothetical protein
MTPLIVVAAVLWLPLSFLLHNIIHEGAHALAALLLGGGPVTLWPFPGKRTGNFTWAHMTYTKGLSPRKEALMTIAPVMAELLWASVFMAVMSNSGGLVLFLLPMVEILFSCIDMTTWSLGAWTEHSYADGFKFGNRMGWTPLKMKLVTLALLPWLAFCGVMIARMWGYWN